MNAQLMYTMVRRRSAELRHASEQARVATEVSKRRRRLREQNTMTHPSADPERGAIAFEAGRAIGGAR